MISCRPVDHRSSACTTEGWEAGSTRKVSRRYCATSWIIFAALLITSGQDPGTGSPVGLYRDHSACICSDRRNTRPQNLLRGLSPSELKNELCLFSRTSRYIKKTTCNRARGNLIIVHALFRYLFLIFRHYIPSVLP